MTRSSRYVRPEQPRPMVLMPRDRAVLRALYQHRHLTSEHIRDLVFPEVSQRMANRRLRHLFEHALVDRHFMPFILDGVHPPPRLASRPIYALAKHGAALLAGDLDEEVTVERIAWPTIEHNLSACGFLVAVVAGARGRSDVAVARLEPEPMLWPQLTRYRQAVRSDQGFIVPDGAVTLAYPGVDRQPTFYIEIVRADVRGGNHTLIEKLDRYAALHHERYFGTVYGHEHVRAVLVATTSTVRADHFRKLAAGLAHGRRLFWFGCYETRDARGRPRSIFTRDNVFSSMWTDVNGDVHSLIPPEALSVQKAAPLPGPTATFLG